MAIGARCSDHPALIGAGAPRIAELGTAARAGVDLRPFGRRREDACATLFDRALQLADQHGTLRDPSLESLASLVLIEGLVDSKLLRLSIISMPQLKWLFVLQRLT